MEQLSEKLFDYFKNIPRSFYLPILLSVAGVIFFGIGLMQLLSVNKSVPGIVQSSSLPKAPISLPSPNLGVTVDIEGAVVNPGVYKLPNTARVQDALIAAGGLSSTADREVVAKNLNLAAKVTDGAKLYIPKIGDTSVVPAQAGIHDTSPPAAISASWTRAVFGKYQYCLSKRAGCPSWHWPDHSAKNYQCTPF